MTTSSSSPRRYYQNIEQRLDRGEQRMDKYDQLISEIHLSQARHDLMLSTFIEEMKELKTRDVDLGEIIERHEQVLTTTTQQWKLLIIVLRWLLGFVVSIGLVILGTYLSHFLTTLH